MPLQATSGAASYDGFGGGVAAVPNYIEDVFSTWLYTGNGSTQTITNGIDLSTKGGLVWIKGRSIGYTHVLVDTARGTDKVLCSNNTNAQQTSDPGFVTQFNTNGFAVGDQARVNLSSLTVASWTFRKQPKFFDVVTYTGNNTARRISHNLGSAPGCIIVKDYSAGDYNWMVYHRSLGINKSLNLNTTGAEYSNTGIWGTSDPTSTDFGLGSGFINNANGRTYVAYLFAHNAGGFGLTGTDNVISCGSFTVDGSGNSSINLGYEPQWLLMKQTNTTGSWLMQDTMRGQTADNGYARLLADTSGAETSTTTGFIRINATGFSTNGATGLVGDHIYIAIRRGPMKTPTTGTSVFSPLANNNSTGTKNTTNFPVDMQINTIKEGDNRYVVDRLRGVSTNSTAQPYELRTNDTAAENTTNNRSLFWDNTGFQTVAYYGGATFYTAVYYNFRRAPGFFDVVCYTGTGSTPQNISHNLGVTPEFMIVKCRSTSSTFWICYNPVLGKNGTFPNYITLNEGVAKYNGASSVWNSDPTSTQFSVGASGDVGGSGRTYVAYLFASCPGVSKVGSYTGTGTTQQINCGFTGGARFVLIKRTDSTGDWYVWDSARGIVSGNDPYLLLNSTAAEVTNTDYIDTYSAGFEISSTAPAAINANGGTFIFLAIA